MLVRLSKNDLAALEQMNWEALRSYWRGRFRSEPPSGRAIELLRLEIAWRLQVASGGDLDLATKRALRSVLRKAKRNSAAEDSTPTVAPLGATIVREWRGASHVVKAVTEGFLYDGRCYRSLSAVARAITGVHWSGPRFFGIKDS
jgi:hypothetical protein